MGTLGVVVVLLLVMGILGKGKERWTALALVAVLLLAFSAYLCQHWLNRGHFRLKCPGLKPVTVPMHHELDPGLLRKIIRDADITVEEFTKLLKGWRPSKTLGKQKGG